MLVASKSILFHWLEQDEQHFATFLCGTGHYVGPGSVLGFDSAASHLSELHLRCTQDTRSSKLGGSAMVSRLGAALELGAFHFSASDFALTFLLLTSFNVSA